MIETYKLLTHRYDSRNGLPLLQLDLNDRTRRNDMKLEIRSVERVICPIATSTINERTVPIIMAGCIPV